MTSWERLLLYVLAAALCVTDVAVILLLLRVDG